MSIKTTKLQKKTKQRVIQIKVNSIGGLADQYLKKI